jgi:hypothetical protein
MVEEKISQYYVQAEGYAMNVIGQSLKVQCTTVRAYLTDFHP